MRSVTRATCLIPLPTIQRRRLLAAVASLGFPVVARATPSAEVIVDKAETTLWGRTVRGDFMMTVTRPSWSRSLALKVWMDRPTRSFVRITAPAKDAGISSLRIGPEMWNYLPAIERTVKVSPSMMLQPWLGSDFTNDDLTKESSIVLDYTHRLVGETVLNGDKAYEIESLPKRDAAVVWGRLKYYVRHDFVPLRLEYFDERGRSIRALDYEDIRPTGGRTIPTRWVMRPHDKPGHSTTIEVKAITYDQALDDGIFTLRNLDRKD